MAFFYLDIHWVLFQFRKRLWVILGGSSYHACHGSLYLSGGIDFKVLSTYTRFLFNETGIHMKPSKQLKAVLEIVKSLPNASTELNIMHLLYGCLLDSEVEEYFNENSIISADELCLDIIHHPGFQDSENSPELIRRVLEAAACQSSFVEEPSVSCWALMAVLYNFNDEMGGILDETGLTSSHFVRISPANSNGIVNYFHNMDADDDMNVDEEKLATMSDKKNPVNNYLVKMNTPEYLGDKSPVIGRDDVIDDAIMTFCRRNKNNVLLVGHPGVGKSAIGHELARRIMSGNVPDKFKNCDIYSVDMGELIAGSYMRGMLEERIAMIGKKLKGTNSVLFIDDIHTAVGSGRSSQQSEISGLLRSLLDNNDTKIMAITSWDAYRKYIETDSIIGHRFNRIVVNEPKLSDVKDIIFGIRENFEEYFSVNIDDAALLSSINATDKYLKDVRLPGKAVEVIDMACSRAILDGRCEITSDDIAREVSVLSNVAYETIISTNQNIVCSMREKLKKAIIGQDEAIDLVVNKIAVSTCGLNDDNKPVASFVFRGTTGCGKTEMAKQISKSMDIPLFRFDMSEYQERHTLTKLIGSPVGYSGYEQNPGTLITAIRENPNCVILLDEIEKGHPDIVTVMLQIMDNAMITSSSGIGVDCQGVVLIMTTNLDAESSSKNRIGFGESSKAVQSDVEFNKFFSPEFRNRLDAIITFSQLSKQAIHDITVKFLDELSDKVEKLGSEFYYDDNVVEVLMSLGYDEKMGARPMKRVIEQQLKLPISIILSDKEDQTSIIVAKVVHGEIVVS